MNPDVVPTHLHPIRHTSPGLAPTLGLHTTNSPMRGVLDGHVKNQFWNAYGAEISQFSPVLMSLGDSPVEAIIGLRSAWNSPLFLETYLASTIEDILQKNTGLSIERHRILEIGNLVSLRPGASSALFFITCFLADFAGCQWLVFTATPQVQKLIRRFHVTPIALDFADGKKLGKEQALWGKYYATNPVVMALSVSDSIRIAKHNPRLRTFYESLSLNFDQLASDLKKHLTASGIQ